MAHPLISMFGNGMGDLMTHDNGQSVIVPSNGQQSGIYHDFSTRHAKGIFFLDASRSIVYRKITI